MAPKNRLVVLAALLTVVVAVGQTPRAAEGVSIPGVADFITLIAGIVPCSTGSSINPALVPGFANAGVQLVCGSTVVANVTTGTTGAFVINLGSSSGLSSSLLLSLVSGQCSVVVTTPLAACDVSLAGVTGTLSSPLRILGSGTGRGVVAAPQKVPAGSRTAIDGIFSNIPIFGSTLSALGTLFGVNP